MNLLWGGYSFGPQFSWNHFGVHILEIVIYLQIKSILNLHVQFQKFFSPIIFSKLLP